MLVQMQYTVQIWPGEPLEGFSVSASSLVMGTWAFNCKTLAVTDLLLAVKKTYIDNLLKQEKENLLDAVGCKNLNVLRQARTVIKALGKKTLSASVWQLEETLQGGFLTLVHNVQITVIEK